MIRLLDASFDESRRAVRILRRNPLFAVCVLALVAVTVGAVTTAGVAAYELLDPRLPYGAPERLAIVWSDLPKSGYSRAPLSGPEVVDVRAQSRTLEAVAAIDPSAVTLNDPQHALQITTAWVTPNFFDVLRAAPLIGRTFTAADEANAKVPPIVLGWQLWQTRFGGDRSIVGRRIQVSNDVMEVVGVMPESFRMVFPPDANVPSTTAAWLLSTWRELEESPRHQYGLRVVARVREGATFAAASEDAGRIGASLERGFAGYAASGRRLFVVGLQSDLAQPVRVPALALLFVGGFLLLLAFVNLAGLWVARTIAQREEHGIHQALGASVGRVRAQLAIQAVLLSVAGSALGIAAGAYGLAGLQLVRPQSLERIDDAALTPSVILPLIAAVAISTLFVAAAAQASVSSMAASALARTRIGSTPRYRFRAALVITQVSLAFVFLVSSVLWTRSFVNLLQTDLGFEPGQALTFRYSNTPLRLRTPPERTVFNRQVTEAIGGIPGVEAVGSLSHLPFDSLPNRAMSYRPDGAPEDAFREADARFVSPGLLRALGGRLRAGRFFSESDDLRAPAVVVVDQLLAERVWPGERAVGKRLHVSTFGSVPPTPMTVVGVVDHVRYRTIEMQVREQIFLPVRQVVSGPYAVVVRASGDLTPLAGAIRDRLRSVDGRVPVWDIRPLDDYYREAAAERRFTVILLVGVAAAAVILASIGVYSLLAFIVASRRGELGVRIALGAQPARLAASVVREGLVWAVGGLVAGALIVLPGVARLSSALYGVSALDPLSWGGAAAVLLLVAAVATAVPALRASGTDPSVLMRSQ